MIQKTKFNPTKEAFNRLKEAVNTSTENDCRDYFIEFAEVLAKIHQIRLEGVFTEYSSFGGDRGDLILYGTSLSLIREDLVTEMSYTVKEVILYECKSPKLSPFKKINKKQKNKVRYLPTKELTEAETQLIGYHDILSKDKEAIRGTLRI